MIKFEKISPEEYINYFKMTCPQGCDLDEDSIIREYENIRLPERETVGSACYTVFSPVDVRLSRYDSSFVTVPTGIKFVCNKNDVVCTVHPHIYYAFNGNMNFADGVHIVNADDYKGDFEGHIVLRMRASEDISIRANTPMAFAMLSPVFITDDDNCTDFRTPTPKPEVKEVATETAFMSEPTVEEVVESTDTPESDKE